MTALFDPARHEPITSAPWREGVARAAIERIATASFDAFDPELGWPCHPLDEPPQPDQRFHMLYFGSGGVIWALEHLARIGAVDRRVDFAPFVAGIVERNRATTEAWGDGTASFPMGDSGLLLLRWTFGPDAALEERLHEVVRGNLCHSTREALWGSPGSVLAAVHLAEATGQERWRDLVREAVRILHDEMEVDADTGTWIWVQDLYGRRVRYLGAGHGFAGNIYPALRAAPLLDAGAVRLFEMRALQTLQATALHDGDAINWHAFVDPAVTRDRFPLVQDCHGAPGIVCRLAAAPRSAEWDALLLAAGELVWRAGPLVKGASICHGTAGSALACLKLARRSGNERWLHRARALAMHGIEQVERHRAQYGMGRHALWTGDLGLACVLWQCIIGGDAFPTLDVF